MTKTMNVEQLEKLQGFTERKDRQSELPASYGWGIRHVQCGVLAAATFMAFSLRVNLSVTIVDMVKYENQSTSGLAPRFSWGQDVQGYLLSSFFWGYFVLQIPAGIITTKFGGHRFLCFAIFSSSLLTVLLPQFAFQGGWVAVCVNRMIQGICQGFVYPSIYTMLGKWSPPNERSGFSSISLGANYLGTVVTTALSGYLCALYGWPSVFYCCGSLGAVIAIVMWLLGGDSPGNHRMISEAEKKYIQTSLGGESVKMAVPWKYVARSVPYWCALLAGACQGMVFLVLFTKIPTYLQTVLHFSVEDNGVLTAVPYLVSFLLTFVFSWASDFFIGRKIMSLTTARKFFNSIAHFGMGACIIMMAYTSNRVMSIVLLSFILGLQAATLSGVQANFVDLAPNFSGATYSFANFCTTCLSLTAPIIIGFIITDVGSIMQWRIVFFGCAAVCVLSNINYLMFGTAETQWWNWPTQSAEGDGDASRRQSCVYFSDVRRGSLVLP